MPGQPLTRNEAKVASQVALGRSNREIAVALGVSVLTVVLGALALLLLSSCGDDDSSDPPLGPTTYLDHTTDSQREILADGEVTPAEYERAFFEYVACLDENGVPHDEPRLNEERLVPRWEIGIGPYRQDRSEEVGRIDANCAAEFRREVELAWGIQEAPSEAEQQARDQAFLDCFRDKTGLEVRDTAAIESLLVAEELSGEQQNERILCLVGIYDGEGPYAQ